MDAMEAIVEEVVSVEDLKKFEKIYNDQLRGGVNAVSAKAQFEYAWCLVRSRYTSDLKTGIALLEDLFHKTSDESAKRDYLFYLAVGNTRLKNYEKALKYTNGILKVEPKNHQAQEFKKYIEKRMRSEGLLGMAIVGGGAALAIGAIITAGIAISKAKS